MGRQRIRRPWREELKDVFSVHEGERRGIQVLLVLLVIAMGWVIYEQWIAAPSPEEKAMIEVAWTKLDTRTADANGSLIDGGRSAGAQLVEPSVHLFEFDPNGLPIEQWVALGLSERQAAVIHHFEEKGGHFRTKKDLGRMRVVSPELFQSWLPFIQLPDSIERSSTGSMAFNPAEGSDPDHGSDERADRRVHTRQLLEVNTADTVQLVAVPGIGPAFARGIVKYRERLGGFHDLEQLKEVYILRDKPDAVERMQAALVVDTLMMRRFALNSFTAEELGPHPYAGWKVAKALVAYRKQHGPFRTIADIKGCALVTDSLYRKLAPYLSAE